MMAERQLILELEAQGEVLLKQEEQKSAFEKRQQELDELAILQEAEVHTYEEEKQDDFSAQLKDVQDVMDYAWDPEAYVSKPQENKDSSTNSRARDSHRPLGNDINENTIDNLNDNEDLEKSQSQSSTKSSASSIFCWWKKKRKKTMPKPRK